MRRIISAILCMIFLIQIVTVSVCAQSQNDKRIMVDTGNGNVQEYTALTVNGEIFLLADDIASIGGYVCNIGDYIGFSKEQGSSFFQFDIDFDGSVHIKKNTYQLEIKKENSQYYLPLEKMLYLMHTTWCVEDGILYVNTLPYSIFDFLEDFYEELCSN